MKEAVSLKRTVLIMFIIIVLIAGAGCGGGGGDTVPPDAEEKTIVIALDPDYITFDPGRAYEMYANMVLNAVYDTLVKFEYDMEVVKPHLADSFDSPDSKVFTFNLNEKAIFSSGNPVTSEDVRWSFERLKYLKSNASFMAANIEKIETPDAHTVIIHLATPEAAFLSKLATSAFCVLDSKTVIEQGGSADENADTADNAEAWLNSNSAGSGAYILESFTPDSQVVLVKNPNYWKGKVDVDRIILKDIPDPNTQQLMIQKGDIDIAYNLASEHVKLVEGAAGVKVLPANTMAMVFLLMNMNAEVGGPVTNPDVQKAIRYALDYKGLQIIAGEGSITPYSIIQVGFLGGKERSVEGYPDVEKAKELLAKAGYPDGFTITFDVATFSMEGVAWMDLGQKIKEDLAKVGINAEIRASELMVGLDEYRNGKQAFALWGWGPDYPDGINQLAFLPGFKVGLRAQWTEEQNVELAMLGKQAMTEVDPVKREQLMFQIQDILDEEGPWAVFLQFPRFVVVRDNIEGADYIEVYKLDFTHFVKK
jgi:peptide/nickel transport system substrate-binding protein